ncbi:MAG: hypothetical protein ACRDTZ_00025 [Pseudonocardiaceae bacterium]
MSALDWVATTATTTDWTPVVVAGLLFAVGYGFACWFWPWTSCRRCEGAGRFRSPSGKNWRRCPKCKGKSSKVRLGRRIFDAVTKKR